MQKNRVDLAYGISILTVAFAVMLLWPGLLPNLLVSNGFMPHGHCYLWKPELVWLHLTSDTLIASAYLAISSTLGYLVYKSRQDIPFHWMFLFFGSFIVACGGTHLMAVVTLWTPLYWLDGEIKLLTAVASVTTAVLLPPLVPKIIGLVEAAKASEQRKQQLEVANQELASLYERLKELDKIKTQFFANVSHELRTPLALIVGPTEKLLASTTLIPEQRQDLQVVQRNARSLLKQVNELLDVSKLEAGKMTADYADVDIAQLVKITASYFESLASDRKIAYFITAPESITAQVDPDQVQRICLNLLSNAFKFTPIRGTIRVELEQQSDRAIITVRDSGSGIPEALRSLIFEPFHQVDASPTRQFGGTGLGLAIVRDFVELHQGSVTITDAPEGGAMFVVTLPLVAPEGVTVTQTATDYKQVETLSRQAISELQVGEITLAPPSWEELENRNAPLVLVVEDNSEMNQFISETLASDYLTANAFNGREGVEKALALRPDLILTDVMMPQMSGEQLVKAIRKHPELDGVPIVVLTAKADDTLRVNLLRDGVQDYLIKPFSSEELRSRVANLIAIKKTRDLLQHQLDSKQEDLSTLATEVAKQNRQLQLLTSELELRVEKRTIELQVANHQLQQEINERQRAELELQKEQEFLKAVLDNIQAGIVACDAAGVLTFFNPTLREFHGIPAQPIPPQNWAQHYDLYLADGKTPMALEQIPLRRALHGEEVKNVEMMVIPKQGEPRTFVASGRALINPQGEKIGAVVVMHDISDRKQAEAQRLELIGEQVARAQAEASKWRFAFLAEARMELSASLDYEITVSRIADLAVPSLADYCVIDVIDRDRSLRRVEVAHIEPEKQQLMQEIQRRYPPENGSNIGIPKVTQTGESLLVEQITDEQLALCACDAEHLELIRQVNPVSAMLVPLKIQGRVLGAITFISAESKRRYDATDLTLGEDLAHSVALAIDNARLYAEAQEANRMKDEFLAVLSHELRTPLNSMLGWVQLLRSRKFDEVKTARALETIERNARAQSQMIEELLDVSRIIRGKLQLNLRQVNLIVVIEVALEALRPTAEVKGVEIESVLDDSASIIIGDSDRLQQIVWNLVSNAIKFTPSGGCVTLQLSHVGNYAQIQVRDTGAGIGAEFLPYVFDRFRQANSSTTRSHGGLGLGLAIVRHLVELHGGSVTAHSPGEGLGASFTVQLPLPELSPGMLENPKPLASMPEVPDLSESSPLQGLRVLVVDDEPDSLEVVSTIVEQSGAVVVAANSVREALEALQENNLDVLVSDIGMPLEDGYSLIRQLRQQETSSGKHLPAIALTAYARDEDKQRTVAAGFEQHLAKPVDPEGLIHAIVTLAHSN